MAGANKLIDRGSGMTYSSLLISPCEPMASQDQDADNI